MLAFDLKRAEVSGRKIRSDSDKIKRLADRLKRAADGTSSWWAGDSRNGFTRRSDELVGLMYKMVSLVTELGEDMLAISKAKKEEEARLKSELQKSLTVGFDGGSIGAVSATASGTGGFIPGTAEYIATGEWPDKGEFGINGGNEWDVKNPREWSYNSETGKFEESDNELWPDGKSVLSAEWRYSDSIAYAGAEVYGKYGSAGIYAGHAEWHAGAGAGLYAYDRDGNRVIAPGVHAEFGGSVSAIYGQAQGRVGNDVIGAYGGVAGSLGTVGAEVGGSVGVFRNENGGYTVDAHVGASARAIAAEATGRAGATVFGVDMGVTGGVNVGVGAHADVGFRDGVLKFDVGASLGVGVSVGFEVDVGAAVGAVVGGAKAVGNWFKGLF